MTASIKKMNKLIIIFGVLLLFSCNRENKNVINLKDYSENDTLVFKYNGFNYNLELSLLGDDDFVYKYEIRGCIGGGEFLKVKGKYVQSDRKLTLNPDSVFLAVLLYNSHDEIRRSKAKYGSDSLRIKTKYDIVNWGNAIHLISPEKDIDFRTHPILILAGYDIDSIENNRNDYNEFADHHNSGQGPEDHGRYLTMLLDTLKGQETPEPDFNQIPAEWRHLFLKSPVAANITDIKLKNMAFEGDSFGIYKVILNKGKRDNLRIGIVFTDKSMAKAIQIVEVEDDKSTGVTYGEFHLNEIVKTQW